MSRLLRTNSRLPPTCVWKPATCSTCHADSVHAAEATSELSVHLTLGFNAPTLFMLVTRALNALSHIR